MDCKREFTPTADGLREWRVGKHYNIHVYEGERPVATFLQPEDAVQAVADHNARLASPPPTDALLALPALSRLAAEERLAFQVDVLATNIEMHVGESVALEAALAAERARADELEGREKFLTKRLAERGEELERAKARADTAEREREAIRGSRLTEVEAIRKAAQARIAELEGALRPFLSILRRRSNHLHDGFELHVERSTLERVRHALLNGGEDGK